MGRSQLPSTAILLLTNWDIQTPSNLHLVTSPALESRKRWSLWHNVPPESVWLQDTCQDPKHTPLVQTYPCFIQGRVPGTPISCLDQRFWCTLSLLLHFWVPAVALSYSSVFGWAGECTFPLSRAVLDTAFHILLISWWNFHYPILFEDAPELHQKPFRWGELPWVSKHKLIPFHRLILTRTIVLKRCLIENANYIPSAALRVGEPEGEMNAQPILHHKSACFKSMPSA